MIQNFGCVFSSSPLPVWLSGMDPSGKLHIGRLQHIWTLYRPSYYNVFEDEQGCDVSNTIEPHRYNGKDFIAKETFIFDKSIPRLI